MMQHKSLITGIVLSFTSAIAVAASSPANYPTRPVRLVVPFAAGGPSDIIGRLMAQKLTDAFGQSFVVDNRGSAGGIVGFEIGAKAPPDGYTLLLATSAGLTVNPSVYRKLPYDPQRDFQPITQVTAGPYLFVINPSVPAKSVPEFIALAKAKPGQLNFATTGTNNLLAMELFNHLAGIKTVAISYKGTGQAVSAVVGGEVQSFIINPLVGGPQVNAGKLRALAVTSPKRNAAFPDLPAIAETLPGFQEIVWHSVIVPIKTPKPIVAKLSNELIRILRLPEIKERFASQGLEAVGSTPDELSALITKETAMYARVVKQIGFQPQ